MHQFRHLPEMAISPVSGSLPTLHDTHPPSDHPIQLTHSHDWHLARHPCSTVNRIDLVYCEMLGLLRPIYVCERDGGGE